MDKEIPQSELEEKLKELVSNTRKLILATNISLAKAMNTSFIATYENKYGICSMAVRATNRAIFSATSSEGVVIYKTEFSIKEDVVSERRTVYKFEDQEATADMWELLNDKMYDWSEGEIESVEID